VFIEAIEAATRFTRPMHTISRHFGSTDVQPGAATLFFVNDEGWALTCRHVAELILAADQILERRAAFNRERVSFSPSGKKKQELELERKYGFGKGTVLEVRNRFLGCVDGDLDVALILHPSLDVALIKFSNFEKLGATAYPLFAANGADLKQGKFLCRLGFPFPEFTNFRYDSTRDEIEWTEEGKAQSPQFPIEGMVTRHLQDADGAVVGFELSTPGLRGQSGGPAFDALGVVWGMQSATNHLDLNFDVDMQVMRDGRKKQVHDNAILHVGHCVHVDVLKEFMKANNVKFAESAPA